MIVVGIMGKARTGHSRCDFPIVDSQKGRNSEEVCGDIQVYRLELEEPLPP